MWNDIIIKAPLFRILTPFVVGISLGEMCTVDFEHIVALHGLSLLLLAFFLKKRRLGNVWFGIVSGAFFVLAGINLQLLNDPSNHASYIAKFQDPNSFLVKVLSATDANTKYSIVQVTRVYG